MTAASAPIRTAADLRGRRTVVLGMGRSGIAASRFLADVGAVVAAFDRRPAGELGEAVRALGGRPVRLALGVDERTARALVDEADILVTSPSISPRFPTTDPWLREALAAAEARGAQVVSEVDLFLRLTRARLLAVTGTKGKTTTAALVAAILESAGLSHALGGNIGRPLIEEAERLTAEHWAVLELSELQLPTIHRGADVAVYTNISADHLDRHGSVEAYRAVKARLAELSAAGGGSVVLNADDPGCRELGARLSPMPPGKMHRYSLDDPTADAGLVDGWILVAGERLLLADEVPLPGRHMLADVLAAALGAHLAGAGAHASAAAIRDFRGVPHRLETVGEREGVRWVNDSQATIPAATIAALEAFGAPVVLIAGGQDKGLDYGALGSAIAARCRAAILMGETAGELERAIGGQVPKRRVADMDEAVTAAAATARAGDVVLLSPAAASFDMFVDYAERGEAFRAAARRIGVTPIEGRT